MPDPDYEINLIHESEKYDVFSDEGYCCEFGDHIETQYKMPFPADVIIVSYVDDDVNVRRVPLHQYACFKHFGEWMAKDLGLKRIYSRQYLEEDT